MKAPRGLSIALCLFTSVIVACAGGGDPAGGSGDDVMVSPATTPAPGVTASGHLRLMAGNLTSGNDQAYLSPGIDIFRGVGPDVAMFQEFNVGNDGSADLRGFVDQAFGSDYSFVRGAATGQIPNGIATRYPILSSGEWIDSEVSNRTFVWAQIDIPGDIDLYAISVHLLTTGTSQRDAQAAELVTHIQSLPTGAYVVLAGDFNTASRTEAALSTLSAVLTTTGPFPVDQSGQANTNANRNKPYDWVAVDPGLSALEAPVTIGASSFAHGLVVDTRVYNPIADLAPAVASDSAASNMQHMGVVRDFALPNTPPPPTPTVTVTSPNGGETWTAGAAQTITWTSNDVTDVEVELSTDNGATWTTLAASTDASTGELAVTAPATATTSALVRVSATGGTPTDTSDAPFTISTGTGSGSGSGTSNVFLNEILANEPGSDTTKEFVELVNNGTGDADLSGWTISDSTQVRHTFAAGTVLAAGHAIVVFGSAAGIPAGLTNAVGSSTGTLSLGNGGDTVTLADTTGTTIDSEKYTSALSGTDGVSMNRSPDGSSTGTWALHTTLSSLASSPGARVDGSPF